MTIWKHVLLGGVALMAAQPAMAQTFNASLDLAGTAANPALAAPWSVVRISGTGCNTAGTLMPLSIPHNSPLSPNVGGWDGQLSGPHPWVGRNYGGHISTQQFNVPGSALLMHPGPGGECSVLRLTVPAGGRGMYVVLGQFEAVDRMTGPAGDGVTGMVLRNGTPVAASGNTADGPVRVHNPRMLLCPGDTLDFAAHMRSNMGFDTTAFAALAQRIADAPASACIRRPIDENFSGQTLGHATTIGGTFIGATEAGDPITMTGTPERPRTQCCGPWAGVDIIPALTPMFPNGAGSPYTMNFTPSSSLNAQMSAYLNYLHALNPSVTQLTMTWQAANLGNGNTAATSGTTIGAAQTVTWNWSSSGVTMTGGGFWSGAPFPLTSWIGFQTTLSVNGGTAGAALLGPDCVTHWDAWRAQPQQIVQGGNAGAGANGRVVFESIGPRGQVQRSAPVNVRAGVPIETGQIRIRN